jgi:hypothetical protein
VAQGDGIDLVDVPRDEFGKRRLGAAFGKFAQQSIVIQFVHPHLNAANGGKVTDFFAGRGIYAASTPIAI